MFLYIGTCYTLLTDVHINIKPGGVKRPAPLLLLLALRVVCDNRSGVQPTGWPEQYVL